MQKLAARTDARHLPDYAPVPMPGPVQSLSKMASARAKSAPSDEMRCLTHGSEVTFGAVSGRAPETPEEPMIKERAPRPPAPMTLAVRRPDYTGPARRGFRHGKQAVPARTADERWLRRLRSRRVDVRPGDALRCMVRIEVRHGHDDEVVGQRWVVAEVSEVTENRLRQIDRLGEGQ